MTRAAAAVLFAAPTLLAAAMLVSACAAAPRPVADVRTESAAQPAADESAEPLPAGIVPLAKEQDERLSQ